jgi:hypothetical protein
VPECEPSTEICNGRDDDCNEEADEDGVCPEGCAGFELDEHVYMFCGARSAAYGGRNQCEEQGMQLVEIESAAENAGLFEAVVPLYDELAETSPKQDGFWIGATEEDRGGDWIWGASGTLFWEGGAEGGPVDGAYANWSPGKPNNAGIMRGQNCAVMYLVMGVDGEAAAWNDLPCSDEEYAFVCEEVP